ncbi:hypothetical protein ACFORL_07000 [Legionella dresdenensis]|uniref:Fido domain-containing protein n=1 Tax=Legionella dresdenensis TaxID=450200 RepID=A0ABV8CEX4_9GAMM
MFNFFKTKSLKDEFENCLKSYAPYKSSNLLTLRSHIPSHEIWRLFVDGRLQSGRGLVNCPIFNKKLANGYSALDYPNLTIKKYITEIEKSEKLKQSYLYSAVGFTLSWRLSEEEMNDLTIGDLLKLDKGWFIFELNEPGYLKAMYRAYDELFREGRELNVETIKLIHQLATDNVANLNYDYKGNNDIKGEFRTTDSGSTGISISEQGVKEFIEALLSDPSKHDIGLNVGYGGKLEIDFTREFFMDVVGIIKNHRAIDIQKFRKYCHGENEREIDEALNILTPYFNELISCHSIEEVAKIICKCLQKAPFAYLKSYQPDRPKITLENRIKELIFKYEDSLSQSTTPLQKLETIINFIQSCEQLHPFADANTRSFSMLLMNFLLAMNGLPLTILSNPNKIALGSKEDNIQDVIKGMSDFISLLNHHSLYGFSSNEVIDFMSRKPSLLPHLQYFLDITQQENSFKTQVKYIAG